MTTLDFGEEIDPADWAPLPADDRLLVGVRTVWIDTAPLIVAQPNRWGMAETWFPAAPCLVEVDPAISGVLPMPDGATGWVDRRHQPIGRPPPTEESRRLPGRAHRLAKVLDQVYGVKLVARPNARTVAFLVPIEAGKLLARCRGEGIGGLRALPGMAGAVAAVVSAEHADRDFETLARVVEDAIRP